jgi:hypothetical protein
LEIKISSRSSSTIWQMILPSKYIHSIYVFLLNKLVFWEFQNTLNSIVSFKFNSQTWDYLEYFPITEIIRRYLSVFVVFRRNKELFSSIQIGNHKLERKFLKRSAYWPEILRVPFFEACFKFLSPFERVSFDALECSQR